MARVPIEHCIDDTLAPQHVALPNAFRESVGGEICPRFAVSATFFVSSKPHRR
jgi:hypothetical protein